MSPRFRNGAIVQDDDAIAIPDGRETMGYDDQACPARLDRTNDALLGKGV